MTEIREIESVERVLIIGDRVEVHTTDLRKVVVALDADGRLDATESGDNALRYSLCNRCTYSESGRCSRWASAREKTAIPAFPDLIVKLNEDGSAWASTDTPDGDVQVWSLVKRVRDMGDCQDYTCYFPDTKLDS